MQFNFFVYLHTMQHTNDKLSETTKAKAREIKSVSAGTWYEYRLRNGKTTKIFVPAK